LLYDPVTTSTSKASATDNIPWVVLAVPGSAGSHQRGRAGRTVDCVTTVLERPVAAARGTRPGALLAVLLIGQFMAILDVSIVNVAAPTIRRDLHASGAGLQMVVGGYLISYAMLLITGARLGDRYGHGRVFRLGLAVFTATSLACGLAPTAASLIVFRFAQGAGAALMMPQLMSLIQRTFSGDARAWALSLYQAVIAGGAVVGQVLGGVLVSADLFGWGWRPVFLVNVPIGLALLAVAGRHLPAGRGEPGRRLDPAGVAAVSVAVLLLVVPLVLGHEEHWPWWTWASLGASAVAFGAFARVERAVAGRGGSPLISGRLLRAPGLVVGALALLLMTLTYGGYLFTMALHLQSGLGDSAARAGLTFAPMAIGFAATALTWQRIPARLHAPMLPTALAVAAVGFVLLAVIMRGGSRGGALLELDLLLSRAGVRTRVQPDPEHGAAARPARRRGRRERRAGHRLPTRPGDRGRDARHDVPLAGARSGPACIRERPRRHARGAGDLGARRGRVRRRPRPTAPRCNSLARLTILVECKNSAGGASNSSWRSAA
jgi:Arabinose efflux permease